MPTLNWTEFERLTGAPEGNFEALARALVRLHYGRFGSFQATAQQPGVEFHLKLHSACALGALGAWIGWQCRWYSLARGEGLGSTRRAKILKAIRTSERVLPGLTEWVLWTRYPLTKGDQDWFYGLAAKFKLTLQTESEVEALLSGDAAMLRGSYFGEWVLRPHDLVQLHERSSARVRHRWLANAHLTTDTERDLRRMLAEPDSWRDLGILAARIEKDARVVGATKGITAKVRPRFEEFRKVARNFVATLKGVARHVAAGDLDRLAQEIAARPSEPSFAVTCLPRGLRSLRKPTHIEAANALADIREAHALLDEVSAHLSRRLVAVIADAGGGKTQLAAQLSAEQRDRPAGILLHGRDLGRGQNLDNLCQKVIFQGKPFPSFEALVGALQAAGERSARRLPLVIDGLNEAQDARDWKPGLAAAEAMLKIHPHVLLIVTLRTGAREPSNKRWSGRSEPVVPGRSFFADLALPADVLQLQLNGFDGRMQEAVGKYFKHFRIEAPTMEIPWDFLSHPLTLRIFCEVANTAPEKKSVGPDALPRSLASLFDQYVSQSAERIAELSPPTRRYYAHDVRRALDKLAVELWEKNARQLDDEEFRRSIGDQDRPWDESMVRLLEQEGLILRTEGELAGSYNIIPVYDVLGGYLVARSLLAQRGRDQFVEWLKQPATLARFTGEEEGVHPLAQDIFASLAAMVPRVFQREQVWNLVDGTLRDAALHEAMRLDAAYLDAGTVEEVARRLHDPATARFILDRLSRCRGLPGHPLNAEFLDRELRKMDNTTRDLTWTEWLRDIYDHQKPLPGFGTGWRDEPEVRTETDHLRARWTMWFQTSTAHQMRDKATRALVWYGRGAPEKLFKLTLESVAISDPYVPERMLAASYGAAMALKSRTDSRKFAPMLAAFARALYEEMFKIGALHPTTHALAREYARRILILAGTLQAGLFTVAESKRFRAPFPKDLHRRWSEVDIEEKAHRLHAPFGGDFENYTVGRLVPQRGNYDFNHPGYKEARARVLWRALDLGWSADKFAKVDEWIARGQERSRINDSTLKVDRYGKKYSLIAYFEMSGQQRDLGVMERDFPDERTWDVDIDPSFPASARDERIVKEDYLGDPKLTIAEWIEKGAMPDSRPYLRRSVVLGEAGPWIALDGYFTQQDKERGRDIFCFIRAFLAKKADVPGLVKALKKQSMRGRWLPEKPRFLYSFAGEFPWSSTYTKNGRTKLRFVVERKTVSVRRRGYSQVVDGKLITARWEHELTLNHLADLRTNVVDKGSASKVPEPKRCLITVEEIRERAIEYKVLMPVSDFGWEGRDVNDRPVRGAILAKEMALDLGLSGVPGTLDLKTADGRAATRCTVGDDESRDNRHSFFFLREDLLRQYLRDTDQQLVWVTWGERGISHNLVDEFQRDRKKFGDGFRVYHQVRVFS